ncbi:TOR complex subunit lst8 [Penicillium ochrochloron]
MLGGSASNISFPESAPTLQPLRSPPPASAPFFVRSAPIDIAGANARQARHHLPVIPDHILRNTAPSRPDSDFYLLRRLPSEPFDTTKYFHSLVASAVAATAPIRRPVTPEIPDDPIKDLLEKTPPKCEVPFYPIMSVLLTTAGYDHTIRFWEALSGICSRTIQHPDSQVNRLCITPDKKYLAVAGHHNVKLFDAKSSNPNPLMTFEGHTGNITGVAFHCEGKWMVTSSEDCSIKVWDVRSGSLQRDYRHEFPVNDVVIHPNQAELISGDRGGMVRVWDLGESKCIHQLEPEENSSVTSVSVATDGSLLCAGSKKGNVYIWRMVQTDEKALMIPIATFQAHMDYLNRVLLSPDVKHLATCSADHTAKVWNLDPEYPPAKAALKEWKEKQEKRAQAGETENTNEALADANRNSNDLLRVFEQDRHLLRLTDNAPREETTQQTFAAQPDGPPMDPVNNTLFLETTLAGHQRWVWDCAFSADSAYLVTVSSDHYARLWELSTGTIIRQYSGHHRGAVCVALNDYSEPR